MIEKYYEIMDIYFFSLGMLNKMVARATLQAYASIHILLKSLEISCFYSVARLMVRLLSGHP